MNLPQEVINTTIFHLRHEYRALLRLCLVCHFCLAESRRYLYREVAVGLEMAIFEPPGCFGVRTKARQLQFLNAISTLNPSLATHIHTFAYTYPYEFSFFASRKRPDTSTLELLNSCLRLMKNLKELSILCIETSLAAIIHGCTFELNTFRFVPFISPIGNQPKEEFRDFVTSQPSLRRLLLWEIDGGVWTQSDLMKLWSRNTELHQLEHLSGDSGSVEAILPLCSPSSLTITGAENFPFHTNLVSQKLRDITVLCLHDSRETVQPLLHRLNEDVMSDLQQLKVLHIASVSFNSNFPDPSLRFPRLRVFIKSFPFLKGDEIPDNMEPRSTSVNEYFNALGHLQAVYFQHRQLIGEAKCFFLYTREALAPIAVDSTDVWDISPWL
ncbi:hypothetical protein NP233_g6306 [Leucocoprinus birnbaumii]|uniref:F-box domain-containing protein n=1 Tax=Leucocoprinus birnbaumii TaxID=56174 RepID=A0AAD5VR85_9AGAR|nr:hypothetical protein NP233_g6306 [Leucocoprinus birnbaumii]